MSTSVPNQVEGTRWKERGGREDGPLTRRGPVSPPPPSGPTHSAVFIQECTSLPALRGAPILTNLFAYVCVGEIAARTPRCPAPDELETSAPRPADSNLLLSALTRARQTRTQEAAENVHAVIGAKRCHTVIRARTPPGCLLRSALGVPSWPSDCRSESFQFTTEILREDTYSTRCEP